MQITHELRASSPSWSPDGQWIAFVKYNDGTYNVARIRPNGEELLYLTLFADGTQIGEPQWSPDSKKLVFYVYRNDQQDIWEMNADGTDLHPLTWDKAEDKDAIYTADGKGVLFSSDRSGIFNVYRIDLATRAVTQVTNVVGGAFWPAETKGGNLLYTGFNAYGFQNFGLKKPDFFGKSSDPLPVVATADVDRNLKTVEELPPIPEGRKYSAIRDLEPPSFVPIARYEDQNVQAGGELIWWDYAGKHALIADVLMGQNKDFIVRYFNDMFRPTLGLIWARFDRKRESGFQISDEGDFAELKLASRVDFYLAMLNWRISPRHDAGIVATYRSFDFGYGATAPDLTVGGPWSFGKKGFSNAASVGFNLNYFTVDRFAGGGTFDVNPRGARELNTSWDVGFTDIVEGGGDVDDGENLTSYTFNTLKASYAEYYAVPWWEYLQHTLQFTLQAGYVDRNVQYNDEFFAGGQHPQASFSDINANTQFAGFEPFSVVGETMLITSLAYRMPVYRDWDKKVGPIYFDSLYLQFFGTAGNLWSFRPLPVEGEIRPLTVTGARRELPFVGLFDDKKVSKLEDEYSGIDIKGMGHAYGDDDPGLFEKAFPVAYKNGNRILTDVGAELRLRAYIYNYTPWFSFFRVAYGLQDTTGIGDHNGDRIFRDLPPNDDPVGEIERKGFRYYLGIGTGW